MADTLGSLVDKLCVTNLKLWFVQEQVHQAGVRHQALDGEAVHKLHVLNLQRNKLMSEIDVVLNEAAKDGRAEVDPRVKIT